jgi:hypothetical protein
MADGKEISLYLTRLTTLQAPRIPLLGMVFESDTRQWIPLDGLTWDVTTRQLSGFHTSYPGIPERAYVATLIGDDFVGSYTQEGTTTAWQARRVWLEGVWASTSPLGIVALSHIHRWEAPLPEGTCDGWHGKFFLDGSWHPLESVKVQETNITMTAQQDSRYPILLTATVLQERMQGHAERKPWQAKRVSDDVLP